MKYLGIILVVLCFTSCQYFDKKKVNANDLLQQELKTVDWSEVDVYPSFASCDSLASKFQNKECFEHTLTTHIFTFLNNKNIIVTEAVHDTLRIHLKISELGELTISEINNSANVKQHIPNIDSLLHNSLSHLPAIYPATKRGQQVKTEFELPIIIQVN